MLCFGLPIAVVALALAGTADAGIIVGWTFDDSTRNPAVTDAHVTASTFDSNDGSVTFAAGNPSTGKSIVDDNWKTPGNYFYFTVDPTSGFMLNLDSLTFDDMKESSLGTDYQISYRVGSSGGFSPGGSGTIHSSFATTPMNTVSLSGISALQGIGPGHDLPDIGRRGQQRRQEMVSGQRGPERRRHSGPRAGAPFLAGPGRPAAGVDSPSASGP